MYKSSQTEMDLTSGVASMTFDEKGALKSRFVRCNDRSVHFLSLNANLSRKFINFVEMFLK